jgi:TPR repeat protein
MAWFQLSANQNFSDAYYSIRLLYQTGKGVPQDLTTSMDYYLKGAAGNSRYFMNLIGRRFLDGIGITIDNYKALVWLERSGMVQSAINRWSVTGFQVTEQDKSRSCYLIIIFNT